jgi:glutamate-ammonia-ligase adenylyltransferase
MQSALPLDDENAARMPSPSDLEAAERGWEDFTAYCAEDGDDLAAFATALRQNVGAAKLLNDVFGNSPFLTQCILREPSWLQRIIADGPDVLSNEVIDSVQALVTSSDDERNQDEAALMRALRIAKRRISLTIAIADISGAWDLNKVTTALSGFADAATAAAARFVIRRAAARGAFTLKNPDDPEIGSGFIVLGMGKLGARELNYSSDIDLICLFDIAQMTHEDEDTDADELQPHVIRMTRTLAKLLDERTTDGYVFRVDLRLRPDPGSTPLAISVLAAETYYESLGQNWERAAMIKARPIAGDLAAGQAFLDRLRPFVWRKSLDFAAIQDIHSIKRQIHAHRGGGEVAVNGHNIKIGRGGIREIEFFAQTQQLIWGGREPSVRAPKTLNAIDALVALDQVSPNTANELREAYIFLRNLEHRLQMQNDEQTQTMPEDDAGITRLAAFFGYDDGQALHDALLHHLEIVQGHYSALFDDQPTLTDDADGAGELGNLAFTGVEADPQTLATIARIGFQSPATVDATIRGWHHGRVRATRSTRARQLLTELTPVILRAIGRQPDPDATFLRFEAFVAALPAGIQLFTMFHAFPDLLNLLAEIMGEAPRLAAHLGRRPSLLESVLSSDFYAPLGDVDTLVTDCRESLTDCMFYEDNLDATRRWNADKRFQVGVQLLRGVIRPDTAARHFSDIADAVLRTLFPLVITEFETRHGRIKDAGFCVLALGKLGSRELTPSSDLDLVFVYDGGDLDRESDGERPLAVSQYFSRLGQRMITAVMSMTAEGALYEIDMRLRPSGNKGPVSSALEGFARYYAEDAWVWEFMALVRARVVFETQDLGPRVRAIIDDALTRPRDIEATKATVAEMRGRIEKTHGTKCIWAIKQVAGGQVDIDFISQYLVLAHTHAHPDIQSTDAVHVFETAARRGLIDAADATELKRAKILYRNLQTFLSLTIEGDLNDDKVAQFSAPLAEDLAEIADTDDLESLAAMLQNIEMRVREIFTRIIGDPQGEPPKT